jgi:hypothetical protein
VSAAAGTVTAWRHRGNDDDRGAGDGNRTRVLSLGS